MHNLDLKLIGERFRMLRTELDLSQKQIAEQLDVHQNAISRLEKGIGASLELFLKLVSFYSNYFVVDKILAKYFSVVRKDDSTMSYLDDVAIEKLKQVQEDFNKGVADIITLLEMD
ncbi:helix-turn-helix domain-containing protein [Chondrinema litorale]|uniref:helix-turn-helix domain-containing protein n=1 Tax=Chondrinema litorale TaxID=2994555 RepID=UPI002542AB2E|nr:helix-turn-helix transcriptional regulator [Chondrinema litorale]UZR99611.1 helix-turn-helix transcriptional regulator [Chondrinema litorale]